jgi:hypothetical protein
METHTLFRFLAYYSAHLSLAWQTGKARVRVSVGGEAAIFRYFVELGLQCEAANGADNHS